MHVLQKYTVYQSEMQPSTDIVSTRAVLRLFSGSSARAGDLGARQAPAVLVECTAGPQLLLRLNLLVRSPETEREAGEIHPLPCVLG